MSRPISVPARRTAHALLAPLACLALMLAGCGRHVPTAPDAGVAEKRAGSTPPPEDVSQEIVATLGEDESAYYVAYAYDAEVTEWEVGERCAKFVPAAWMTREQLATYLENDPRCASVDFNSYLFDAETRQQSFAFDDGLPGVTPYLEQPATRALRLEPAHRVTKGRGVAVAIIDNGVDATHPALAGRVLMGHDFVDDDEDPTDRTDGIDQDGDGRIDEAHGHGTHVAGIVALTAPEAPLLIARVLDADGRGDVLDVAAGIRWAIRKGARVINLSLGTLDHVDAIQLALEEAEARNIIVVASAGNWGSGSPEEFPARSANAHAVAATDTEARPAPFTSFAPWVAIAAPGVGVRSAYPGGVYRLWSGTSMSTPFVAGAAALVRERHPQWTSDRVMSRLRWAARPIQGASKEQEGNLGRGMLDVLAAVRADHVHGPPDDSRPPVDPIDPAE